MGLCYAVVIDIAALRDRLRLEAQIPLVHNCINSYGVILEYLAMGIAV